MNAIRTKVAQPPVAIVARVAAALLGGWAVTWGFITLGIVASVAAGMDYHDAEHLAYLLAFPLYLTVFCWSFVHRSLARVWVVLATAAICMSGVAWWWAGAVSGG
jgi:hypothetical protein